MGHDTVDLVVGVAFVLFYAAHRFNTPPTNRSSTTAGRYALALVAYLLVALGVYVGLVQFPHLLAFLAQNDPVDLPEYAKHLSNPLLVALLVTVLLPKLPVLSAADAWIFRQLQAMAAIPYEVRRLSAALRKQPFAIPEETQAAVREALRNDGFDDGDIRFEPGDAPQQLWTRTAALAARLEEWERDRRMCPYLAESAETAKALRERRCALEPRAKTCFRLLRETAAQAEEDKAREAARSYAEDFCDAVAQLRDDVLEFVSRGVLRAELTDGARNHRLEALGFAVACEHERFTLNQMMALFALVGVAVLSTFVVASGHGLTHGVLLVRVLTISLIYSVAVACVVFPKERWSFAKREPGAGRPVAFYFVAGLLAVAITQAISFGLSCLLSRGLSGGAHRYLLTYPWGLVTFATSVVTGFLLDDEPPATWPRWSWRLLEGALAAIAMMAAAYVTVGWLHERVALVADVPANYRVPGLASALAMSAFVGFVIGCFVPASYREAPRDRAEPSPEPRPPLRSARATT